MFTFPFPVIFASYYRFHGNPNYAILTTYCDYSFNELSNSPRYIFFGRHVVGPTVVYFVAYLLIEICQSVMQCNTIAIIPIIIFSSLSLCLLNISSFYFLSFMLEIIQFSKHLTPSRLF